jgi:hypothetical protein
MTAPVNVLAYLRSAFQQSQINALVTQNPDGTLLIQCDIGAGPAQLYNQPLVGSPGPAGAAQFPLNVQPTIYTDPNDLPAANVLTNTVADIGRFWMIVVTDTSGNCISVGAYIWYGQGWRFLPFGIQGPPGPYGVIAPTVQLLGPNQESQQGLVTGAGTAVSPYQLPIGLSVPTGPPGPSATLASMADFVPNIPTVGQFVTATGNNVTFQGRSLPQWAPSNTGELPLMPYIVPQAAFVNAFGVNFGSHSFATIAAFQMPSQAWNWIPLVFGQIRMFEVTFSLQPLQIGVTVNLGTNQGTLIARGFGNTLSGVVSIMPHTSTPGSPTTAFTPSGPVGVVNAGAVTNIFVNIFNDGIVNVYDYNPSDAQLFVLACPVTTAAQLGQTVPAGLTVKASLSAASITHHP